MSQLSTYYNNIYEQNKYMVGEDRDLFAYLDIINKGKVLEVGIGIGKNMKTLIDCGFQVTGIDVSDYAISKLKKEYPSHNFFTSDILDFDIEENEYDLIICSMVLHHLEEKDVIKAIDKMKHGLKKDGVIFISLLSDRDPSVNRKGLPYNDYLSTVKSNLSLIKIMNTFKDIETLTANDLYFSTNNRDNEYLNYYGIIVYIGKK